MSLRYVSRLNAVTYNYLSYRNPNLKDRMKLPLVPIILFNGDMGMKSAALVDSGSNITLLPKDIAEALQLTPTGDSSIVGAGGVFVSHITNIPVISLMKGREEVERFENIRVQYPESRDAVPYVILGRDTVFRKFDIRFDENKQNVVLRRYFKPNIKSTIRR